MKKWLFLLFVPSLVSATKIVSQQAGNWGDTASWVGGVIPGNKDEVKLFHVISTTDTRTIGVSVSSGSFAIDLQSTGSVHVTSTGHILVRGYATYTSGSGNTNDAVTVDGSGAWEFDASLTTAPKTIDYSFYPSGSAGYRKFKVSGSSSAYASLYSNSSSSTGTLTENGQSDGGVYELYYASVTNMGFDLSFNNGGSIAPTKWDAQFSSFTHCNLINTNSTNLQPTSVFRHEFNYHQNTLGLNIFAFNFRSFKDPTGVRSIKNNFFDVQVGNTLGFGDFTIQNNFMNDMYAASFSTWSVFTNNFVRVLQPDIATAAGPMTDDYMWWNADQQNPHVLNVSVSSNIIMTGMIYGQSGKSNNIGSDDSGEFWLQDGPGNISTTSITNSIFLPNSAGYSSLEITSLIGTSNSSTWANNRFVCEHNTWFGGWNNSNSALPPFAALDYSETSNMSPSTISSFRSNLLWNTQFSTQPAQFFKVIDVGNVTSNLAVGFGTGPTQDVCAPSHCDYNSAYPVALSTATGTNVATYTNQGKGYAGKFSSTPGTHDVDSQNPRFVDYHRYFEKFDSGYYRPYYGIAQPTGWSSGASYNQGDVVSHSTGTYYWGDTLNYVYISSGFCNGLNPEPGAYPHKSWDKCWIFASINDFKQAILSSMTFTDSAIGASNSDIQQTMLKWIRAGYAPTNTALRGVAHDGGDIGAVSVLPSKITGAWFTTSEKVARQDLWPHGNCSSCAITTNWNGKNAYMFGAKGEIIHGITYIQNNTGSDATNVNITISSFTDNQGHYIIPVTVSSGSVWNSSAIGPINLFYVRYLPIRGETQESWDPTEIDERDLPPLFRVPYTISGSSAAIPNGATQLWINRQDHDKFYPEIEVPYELVAPSSFTVSASSSQAIGLDVYIDTNTFIPAGQTFNTFFGTMTIKEDVNVSTTVPIQIKVYNFTMPTSPGLKVLAAVGASHIGLFHGGNSSFGLGGSSQTTREHYYQYLWRNGIIPVGDDKCTLGPGCTKDYPSNEYVEQLNGSLFTNANGFGNSPRLSSGVPFYMLGTYGNWIDQTNFSSTTITGTASSFCSNISSWSTNMSAYPGARTSIYLCDEPDSSHLISDCERLASTMTSTCNMPGSYINSWITSTWVEVKSSATHITNPVTTDWAIFSHLQTDWPIAASYFEGGSPGGHAQAWMYNGHPPASGTMFATEDTGQSAELFGPSAWKKGVQGMFLWEVVNWDNSNNLPVINDLFNDAHTFGQDIYPSTSAVRGRQGFNYSNGDGVLLYPGRNTQDPTNNYGFDGPIGGFRLKMVRNGINMYDYASMASAINSSSATAIVNTVIPTILYEVQPVTNHGYYYGGRQWSDNPQIWESNRELLAQIIATAAPATSSSRSSETSQGKIRIQGKAQFQ